VLNHVRRGSGEPLLLIHPLGGELVVWEPVLDRLARERDVIALDLPGFGESPALADGAEPTPRALAGAVASLLDELGLGRAHVAGNSLGGWVALELAKAGRARSVAGLCTAGLWKRPLGPRPGGDVRVVVTLAWAELDRLVRRPRETVPEWRTLMLHGCGHIPTWDDPEQVARVLLLASA
jgi:pimeloyl-ACP methyl ester carboxylesterase